MKQIMKKAISIIICCVMLVGLMPAMEVKADEKISTVSATTITILAGTNISEALKSVQFDETKMKFDQVTFYDSEAGRQWNSKLNGETAEKFVEGKTYEITIRLEALEGYSFAITGATINGITAVIETQSAGSVVFTCEYTVPEATAVNSVDIFVTAPKSGEVPDTTAKIADAQKDKVSVSGDVYWGYGPTGSYPANEGIFVKGNEYKVVVTLETAPGYKLAEDTVCTINGNPATFNKEYNTATYTFPELEVTVLKNVDIFVTDPKSGEVPDTTARIADAQKDKVSVSGDVYWGYGPTGDYPVLANEGIFVKGKEYEVSVKLATAQGYKFADDTVFTINGNPATFNKEYNTVTYKYPLLETIEIPTAKASCDLTGGVKLSDYQIGIPEDANYEVNASSVKWYEGVGSSVTLISNLDTEIYDTKEYTLEFDLVAKDGYGFPSTATFDIDLPKEASADVTLYNTSNRVTIKVSFDTGVVGATNITVPIPTVGELLPTVVSDNEDCIVDKVEWYCGSKISDPSYIVEEGKSYMAIITLKPGARYLFWDSFNLEEIGQRITLNNEIVTAEHIGYKMDGTSLMYDVTLEPHYHNYSTEWSKDATEHWHECTICGAKKDEHEHVAGAPATEKTPQTCTVCGYEIAPAKGHSFGSEWSKDATNHWHECACGEKKDVAAHTYDDGKITKAPTETADGVKTFTCTVCGATKIEKIPATGSSAPKVGTKLKDAAGKAVYKVTSANKTNLTVEYTAPVNNKSKSITIPAIIKVNGITYKVTSIAKNAFKNNKKLTKVTIGKNVTTIGDMAFYKCTALTKITIPSKVNKIGKQAFYGCKKLKSITIKSTKLTSKKVGKQAFKGINAKATIKVPKSKLKVYKKLLKSKGIGSKATIKK